MLLLLFVSIPQKARWLLSQTTVLEKKNVKEQFYSNQAARL